MPSPLPDTVKMSKAQIETALDGKPIESRRDQRCTIKHIPSCDCTGEARNPIVPPKR